MSSAAAAISYTSFDALGRVTASAQTSAGQVYPFAYSYNLADSLVAEAYPSGRVIATSYDAANRPVQVAGTMAGAQTVYLSGMSYAAHGAPAGYQYGNALTRQAKYNVRLQPSSTIDMVNNNLANQLLALYWNWGTTDNNGNLQSISRYNGGPGYSSFLQFNQSFSYDGVNRLTGASDSGGWSRAFQYDQYGNMWLASNAGVPLAGNTPTSNVYTGSNQISGGSYDGAGYQTAVNGNTLVYDAENHMVSVTEPANLGGATETLAYDGAGHRVAKTMPSGQTVYVYDAFDQLAAEYSTVVPSAQPCTTCYLSMDHLGSTRLVTDANANVVTRHDFLPFGEELPPGYAGRNGQWAPGGDNVDQKFTGQVRDQETGLDYFNARYFGAALGRFTSPDPGNAGADPSNPQTWNAYAYALNNPLVTVDPSGADPFDDGSGDGGDDPCFWNPFLCGFSPLPPPIFVGGGGGGNNGTSSGQTVDKTPLPPNSFPGGETLGVPPGMHVPLPGPGVLLGLGLNLTCDFGVCVGGVGANGYVDPVTVGAGTSGAAIAIDIGLGTICIGSGVCEVAAIAAPLAVAAGAGAYIIYKKVSKKFSKEMATDTPSWASYHPSRRPDGSCASFAERVLVEQYGPGHPKTSQRGGNSEYSQIKKNCERGGL